MSDKPYIRKIILTSIVMAIMLLLILIPASPVYGWLNKGRYQQIRSESDQMLLDTATGHVESYSQNWDVRQPESEGIQQIPNTGEGVNSE